CFDRVRARWNAREGECAVRRDERGSRFTTDPELFGALREESQTESAQRLRRALNNARDSHGGLRFEADVQAAAFSSRFQADWRRLSQCRAARECDGVREGTTIAWWWGNRVAADRNARCRVHIHHRIARADTATGRPHRRDDLFTHA